MGLFHASTVELIALWPDASWFVFQPRNRAELSFFLQRAEKAGIRAGSGAYASSLVVEVTEYHCKGDLAICLSGLPYPRIYYESYGNSITDAPLMTLSQFWEFTSPGGILWNLPQPMTGN